MILATPPVPVSAQHAIAKRAPLYAYVPARVGNGYRYAGWTSSSGVRIIFRNAAGRTIVFSASRQHGVCSAGREKTFQLAGNKVYWSQSATGQQAWRCVGAVRLAASTTLPPTKFADVGLGRIASSGHKIRSL
jgi:hypothetical protein